MSLFTSTMTVAGRISPKNFPVSAPDLFPLVDIGEVHPCLDDILQGSAGAFECRLDVAQCLTVCA